MVDAYTPAPRILEAVFCRGRHWSGVLPLELEAHRDYRQRQDQDHHRGEADEDPGPNIRVVGLLRGSVKVGPEHREETPILTNSRQFSRRVLEKRLIELP
jgi:hypothetical protein